MAVKLIDFIAERMGSKLSEKDLIAALKKENLTVGDIGAMFKVPYQIVKDTIDNLKDKKILLEKLGDHYTIKEFPVEGAKIKLDPAMWQGEVLRFGFVSDNHLGSNFERLDVLNLLYDLFRDEGIKIVLHGGNFIEGEARFNKNEIHKHGFAR